MHVDHLSSTHDILMAGEHALEQHSATQTAVSSRTQAVCACVRRLLDSDGLRPLSQRLLNYVRRLDCPPDRVAAEFSGTVRRALAAYALRTPDRGDALVGRLLHTLIHPSGTELQSAWLAAYRDLVDDDPVVASVCEVFRVGLQILGKRMTKVAPPRQSTASRYGISTTTDTMPLPHDTDSSVRRGQPRFASSVYA